MTRWLIAASLVCVATAARAAGYRVSDGSSVQFVAHITGGSFTAKTSAVRGSIQHDAAGAINAGAIVVGANSLDSGMAMRDQHMREKYLETEHYPIITLDLTGATLPANDLGAADLDGSLEIHGVKRREHFHVVITDTGNGGRRVTGDFRIDITEYGIAQPKFAVVKMDTKVEVSVDLRFVSTGN